MCGSWSSSAHLELFYSSHCAAISRYPGWKRVLKLYAKHLKLPHILARTIPKLFTFWTDMQHCWFSIGSFLGRSKLQVTSGTCLCFWSTFQWWILSLWLCPLATKLQPAPWVIVCGYNSVGCDQYVTESGMSMHEQHPVCNYISSDTQSMLDSDGLSALF